jgi:hypothetical protein
VFDGDGEEVTRGLYTQLVRRRGVNDEGEKLCVPGRRCCPLGFGAGSLPWLRLGGADPNRPLAA